MKKGSFSLLSSLTLALLVGGCQSPEAGKTGSTPAAGGGIAYRNDKDLQKIWIKDGFDFSGYDALLVTDAKFQAKERPNEVEMKDWVTGYVRESLVAEFNRKHVFPAVVTAERDLPAGKRTLRLDLTITEFEKGGGGARYFAGIYGAGQPVVRVLGKFQDDTTVVFQFESRRSGDSGGSRMFGGFKSDKDIQREDLDDLAKDLADFILRTAAHTNKK